MLEILILSCILTGVPLLWELGEAALRSAREAIGNVTIQFMLSELLNQAERVQCITNIRHLLRNSIITQQIHHCIFGLALTKRSDYKDTLALLDADGTKENIYLQKQALQLWELLPEKLYTYTEAQQGYLIETAPLRASFHALDQTEYVLVDHYISLLEGCRSCTLATWKNTYLDIWHNEMIQGIQALDIRNKQFIRNLHNKIKAGYFMKRSPIHTEPDLPMGNYTIKNPKSDTPIILNIQTSETSQGDLLLKLTQKRDLDGLSTFIDTLVSQSM